MWTPFGGNHLRFGVYKDQADLARAGKNVA